ncbi:flagellar operon protein TIGR03826 [Acetitomaculum ruminis DSM 5522]|uniref:Flagellar operon protein TIGR03826 n=1 Tax=Acetitomaculum ruminis DSM 5522 TaxID=1120918 RepID=A0A1I0YI50_9FIRM|nr:flagellar protein [Acetitomaculum ruminis]SFB13049.1 flagellar operon protein TIGR03826 [Acetitomaculum ruminis DSM 5522]
MEVKNCKTCGKLFNYVSGPRLCPACIKQLEDKFHEVRDYIRKKPKSELAVIAEECDVSVNQIKQWVREERLSFDKDSPVALECENCGAKILTGRYCKNCKDEMKNGLNAAIAKPDAPKKDRKKMTSTRDAMRFLNR